jgi:uncharacterized protein (TIGR02757 family)
MTWAEQGPFPDDESLRALLDSRCEAYNRPDFIESDPISVPHLFSAREDIEISGLFSALIAWGQRVTILRNARELMRRMDMSPGEFVRSASEADLSQLEGFVHRTFNGTDARSLVLALREACQRPGGLEGLFAEGIGAQDEDVKGGIIRLRQALIAHPAFAPRSRKHLADPAAGASAKRLNMFLRWMVRQDKQGVDFGLWTRIRPAQLICPLDVHSGNVARKLGLLARKQNDWQAAAELTARLRRFCPEDPVRYDFSLFGLGAFEGW